MKHLIYSHLFIFLYFYLRRLQVTYCTFCFSIVIHRITKKGHSCLILGKNQGFSCDVTLSYIR